MQNQPLTIADRSFRSRLMLGTGKFASGELMRDAIIASGTEIVTVALRRADLSGKGDPFANILDFIPKDVLLLPNTSAAGAIFLGETIRSAVAALSPEINGQHLSITISIGIASSSQQLPMPPEQLLNLADKALYRAKKLGRNRVALFEPERDQGSA